MELWQAIVLGVLQGLTEFIPVSSTAHLTIAGRMMGLVDDADPAAWTAFLAVVQLGTLAAVLWYFRADLWAMARGERHARRLLGLIVLATIPLGIVGLLLRDVIEGPLTKDLRVIAAALIGLAVLLALADRFGRRERHVEHLGWRDALIVGGAQVLALIPGASRSGTTLTGGLASGLTREAAARFSFLLSIPAIAASGLFELPVALRAAQDDIIGLVVATAAAALAGYAAIAWMLRFLRTRTAMPFAAYRVVLGVGLLAALALAWL